MACTGDQGVTFGQTQIEQSGVQVNTEKGMLGMCRPLDFLKHQVNGKNFKELLITPEKEQFYYLVIYKLGRTYANVRRQHLLLKTMEKMADYWTWMVRKARSRKTLQARENSLYPEN